MLASGGNGGEVELLAVDEAAAGGGLGSGEAAAGGGLGSGEAAAGGGLGSSSDSGSPICV